MIETPAVTMSDEIRSAVVRVTVPTSQIRDAMDSAIAELTSILEDQGIQPAGPMYTRHFHVPDEKFDFELGFPVAREVTPAGRVRNGVLPAVTVARAVHAGGYEGLVAAWGELTRWMNEQGLECGTTGLWERYIAGPETNPDPASWRTELNRPVVAGPGA